MYQIAESELIINKRGAIYHLNVRPEELGDTIILVGDPGRVKRVSKHFDRIDHQLEQREFITHTGFIGNTNISVVSTGIGPDNIDIAINEIDALANIDFNTRKINPTLKKLKIIRFGTCGALQADVPIDSMIASSHGLGLDNLMNYYDHKKTPLESEMISSFIHQTSMDTSITLPYIFEGSTELISKFGADFHKGITVTCPGFYGPQGRVLRLALKSKGLINKLSSFNFNDLRIVNFEMETSAIYGLGKLLGHDCLSINVAVANRVTQEYSDDSVAAVEKMIEKALAVIVSG